MCLISGEVFRIRLKADDPAKQISECVNVSKCANLKCVNKEILESLEFLSLEATTNKCYPMFQEIGTSATIIAFQSYLVRLYRNTITATS